LLATTTEVDGDGLAAVAGVLSCTLEKALLLPADPHFPPRGPELRPGLEAGGCLDSALEEVAAAEASAGSGGGEGCGSSEAIGRLEAAAVAVVTELCTVLPSIVARLPGGRTPVAQAIGDAVAFAMAQAGEDPTADIGASQEALEAEAEAEAIRLLLQLRGPPLPSAAAPSGDDSGAETAALGCLLPEEDQLALTTQLLALGQRSPTLQEELNRWGWCASPAVSEEQGGGGGPPQLLGCLAALRASAQRRRASRGGSRSSSSSAVAAEVVVPAGSHASVELLRLIVLVLRTGRADAAEAVASAGLLPCCLRTLLGAGRWSSVLHCAAGAILAEAARSGGGGGTEAAGAAGCMQPLLDLLADEPLMRQFVETIGAGGAAREAQGADLRPCSAGASRPKTQVAALGILRQWAAELCACAAEAHEVAASLACLEGWSDVVLPEVEHAERLREEPLGGPLPQVGGGGDAGSFDCLAVVQAAMARGEHSLVGLESALSLEDLRDLHEEQGDEDEPELLDMLQLSGLHTRRRAKAEAAQQDDFDDPLGEQLEGLEALALGRPGAPVLDGMDNDLDN